MHFGCNKTHSIQASFPFFLLLSLGFFLLESLVFKQLSSLCIAVLSFYFLFSRS